MLVNLNGKFLNEQQASISVNNRSFRFGDGCFETMRLVNGRLPLADLHFQRLFHTLEVLQYDWPSFFTAGYLTGLAIELANKNGCQASARVRITFFRGDGGLHDPENLNVNWLIQTWSLEPLANTLHENGLQLGIFTEGFKAADKFANLKSNNFLLYSQAAIYAKQQKWNDAFVLNHKGSIADATIANLFVVQGETIITPSLEDGPLAGVMRRYLLEQLPAHGYTVLQQSISPESFNDVDAVFLSNAVFGVRWVKSIGDYAFGPGPTNDIFQQIILALFRQ